MDLFAVFFLKGHLGNLVTQGKVLPLQQVAGDGLTDSEKCWRGTGSQTRRKQCDNSAWVLEPSVLRLAASLHWTGQLPIVRLPAEGVGV